MPRDLTGIIIISKPEKNSKAIEEGVRKMFEKFPPPPEKR
jgi:hypothetical protein